MHIAPIQWGRLEGSRAVLPSAGVQVPGTFPALPCFTLPYVNSSAPGGTLSLEAISRERALCSVQIKAHAVQLRLIESHGNVDTLSSVRLGDSSVHFRPALSSEGFNDRASSTKRASAEAGKQARLLVCRPHVYR